jgi:hypothetical protein
VLTWIAFDRRGTDKEIATSQRIATSVGYGIQPVLGRVYAEVSQALCASLKTTTITDVLRDAVAEYEAGLRG